MPTAIGASPSTTPALVATPLPPLKPTKTEKTCPTTASTPQTSGNHGSALAAGPEDQHRHRALGDVEQPDRNRVPPSHDAVDVRGAEVLAAVLAEVDAPEEPPGQVAGRDGAEQVRGRQRDAFGRVTGSAPTGA